MIHKVVLTGGPCGGKTSALPLISDHFKKTGFQVYTVPEMATLFHGSGVNLVHKITTAPYALEHAIFSAQLALEKSMQSLTTTEFKDTIILCDRGLGDLAAYTPVDIWGKLLCDFTMTPDTVLTRYNAVVHLVTAAIGAEKHFTNENNPARNCSPELARELDRKTFSAWSKHPNLFEIDNSTDFDGKIKRAIDAIEKTIDER